LAEEPPKDIPKEYAKNPSDSDEIFFPEFENYKIFEGTNVIKEPEKMIDTFKNIAYGVGGVPSYLKEKYNEYQVGSKIKSGLSYIYNKSKPIVQYTSNKVVEGAKYLYNKISEKVNGTTNSEKNENNINIIRLDEGDDAQKSDLIFEKTEYIDDKEKEDNNISNQDFPSLSKINQVTNDNKNGNDESDNSAAPMEIKMVISESKDN
jgi:hypothetical protein